MRASRDQLIEIGCRALWAQRLSTFENAGIQGDPPLNSNFDHEDARTKNAVRREVAAVVDAILSYTA